MQTNKDPVVLDEIANDTQHASRIDRSELNQAINQCNYTSEQERLQKQYDHFKKVSFRLLSGEKIVGNDGCVYSLEDHMRDTEWGYGLWMHSGCNILDLFRTGLLDTEQQRQVNLNAQIVAAYVVG